MTDTPSSGDTRRQQWLNGRSEREIPDGRPNLPGFDLPDARHRLGVRNLWYALDQQVSQRERDRASPLRDVMSELYHAERPVLSAMTRMTHPHWVDWHRIARRGPSHEERCPPWLGPRVTLHGRITSQGNLSVAWEPTAYQQASIPMGWDFHLFGRGAEPGHRPTNELLFVRGIGRIAMGHPGRGQPELAAFQHFLLLIAFEAWNEVLEAVGEFAEVAVGTALELELERGLAVGLTAVDVGDREREDERRWLAAFAEMTGMGAARFVGLAVEQYVRRHRDGSPRGDAVRFSRAVGTQENALMPAAAERVLTKLRACMDRCPRVVEEICGTDAVVAIRELEARLSAR